MKGILLICFFVPALLFAQTSQQFVVKKKEPVARLYYSQENVKGPSFINYLWLSNTRVCFYSSTTKPEAEYSQFNLNRMQWDSLSCYNYVIEKDSVKFTVNTRVPQQQGSPYTYKADYTFYTVDKEKMLRLNLSYSKDWQTGGIPYRYIEYVPEVK